MSKLLNLSLFVFLFLSSNHSSNGDKIQKKILRINGFDIECYVSLKEMTSFDENKMYYWYKSGEIHQSISSAGGLVLHSKFDRFYESNQLVEQGAFDYGLKNGVWKTWNEDGSLNQTIEWNRGLRDGDFRSYDALGNLIEKGSYKKDKRNGSWINLITKDTLKYKSGEPLILDNKTKKEIFFKRLFKKKDSSNTAIKTKNSKNDPAKKDGFLKRLFKKKDKKFKMNKSKKKA